MAICILYSPSICAALSIVYRVFVIDRYYRAPRHQQATLRKASCLEKRIDILYDLHAGADASKNPAKSAESKYLHAGHPKRASIPS